MLPEISQVCEQINGHLKTAHNTHPRAHEHAQTHTHTKQSVKNTVVKYMYINNG